MIDFAAEGMPGWKPDDNRYRFDTARLRHVTELVAEKSGWARKKSGARHGFGLAAHWSFLSYIAAVVEVESAIGSRGVEHPRMSSASAAVGCLARVMSRLRGSMSVLGANVP